ncbi:MAG: ABC transporter, substrate-binding protein (cluster 11, riboflavin/purine nucleoside/unknown) [uncultured Acidimicrobiales bacterium]|uniref:ABC transporter substrate-binding protein PnrA-like domain-containing protein n=1 Tax=uncultured Acidimicrobiales bacterium TaxID=310071 RepID=A0A6J4HJ32_9ACTN|nr:MAG: ABC transporter, substrate-binding protein (cluster 11, riboflavin/purine nucleoside/unknown) [uncultured Acidimicrobiales bacterium]
MRTRRWFQITALLAGLSLFAAACADEDDEVATDDQSETEDGSETESESDTESESESGAGSGSGGEGFKACQVTDIGGIDDRSFNETAYEGILRAEEELGAESEFLESGGEEDYATNIAALMDQGCDLIVTVGFLLGDATLEAAEANPDQDFAIVDFAYDEPVDNIKPLLFNTNEAAFLAGYLAAGMTETGTVGTFGGVNVPPVTIFMDGFLAGIEHHNTEKGTDVALLGWDGADGLFTGDFEDQDKGRQTAQSLLDEGADIVFPVAGPVGLGAAAAVRDAGDANMVWVDSDGCESAAEFCDLFITSVLKNIDNAVFDTIETAQAGELDGEPYLGTLENDGVGLAELHEFEDDVPQELKDELEALQASIIAGDIPVGG